MHSVSRYFYGLFNNTCAFSISYHLLHWEHRPLWGNNYHIISKQLCDDIVCICVCVYSPEGEDSCKSYIKSQGVEIWRKSYNCGMYLLPTESSQHYSTIIICKKSTLSQICVIIEWKTHPCLRKHIQNLQSQMVKWPIAMVTWKCFNFLIFW